MEVFIAIAIIVGLFVGLQLWMRRKARRSVGEQVPQTIASDAFFQGGDRKLLYFWSPTCGPCIQMMPAVDAIKKDHPTRVKKVDLGSGIEWARAFNIMATPTTIVVKDQKVEDVRMGVLNGKQLQALL
jgi:thioredoxin 1